jgi:hypothetical protein
MLDRWNKYISLLGITLLPYQEEIAHSLLGLPYTAKITQCRQSGKSFIMALVLYFLSTIKHWDIIITAPKIDQTWAIMKHIHKIQSKIGYKTDFCNRYSISHRGRGSIICLSGSETANVEGASAHIVVVDEHQDMLASHVAEVFVPMISWHNGLYWSCGIGGHPSSVSERSDIDYIRVLPYQEVVLIKPDYQRLVELARQEMLPEEFAAHYECKKLDISAHLLVPTLVDWDGEIDLHNRSIRTVIGLDFGKLDHTIGTQTHYLDNNLYIQQWIVAKGSYDQQVDELAQWIADTPYDEIYAETNGVGDSVVDFLARKVPDTVGIHINQDWKNERARELNAISRERRLHYNINHELAGIFKKEMDIVSYKVNINSNVQVDHSDFVSSLFMCMEDKRTAYL